jgi:hypothetical protein
VDHIENYRDDFFFLKSDDWASEHEFRALLLSPEGEYAYVEFDDALRAIVLGEGFPAWQIPGALDACQQAGVELKKIVWHAGRPFAVREEGRSENKS